MFRVLMVLTLTLFASASFARSTTCASGNFHYYHDIFDRGQAPMPGQMIGRTTISLNGEVLLDKDIYSPGRDPIFDESHRSDREDKYFVELGGERRVIEENSNQFGGRRLTEETAKLFQAFPGTDRKPFEITKRVVICQTLWANLP